MAEATHKKPTEDRAAALNAYEDKHATVHAQALVVLNIKVLVPMMLDRC
jgi:hypothetical protein